MANANTSITEQNDEEITFKNNTNNITMEQIYLQNTSIMESNKKILEKLEGLEIKTNKLEQNYLETNQKVTDIISNMETMKKNVEGVVESQTLISTKFEESKTKISQIEVNVNKAIRAGNTHTTDIMNLKKSLDDLKNIVKKTADSVNDLEQYGRRSMVDICGVPRSQGENTETIVTDVAKLIGIDITENDIEACHRTSKEQNAPIIVKFLNRKKRNLFFSNRNQLKGKTTKDIGYDNTNNKIYVNESLTRQNGSIFKAARNKLGDRYKYKWTVNGVTMVREKENSITKSIKSITDLNGL